LSQVVRICFVCLGNIVRSPLAEGLFNEFAKERGVNHKYSVDSAGTGDWHVGEPPDWRMRRVASRHGLHYDGRARQFRPQDLENFDLIVAMDTENREDLLEMCNSLEERHKIRLLREFDPFGGANASVPDPYYGGMDGFEEVYGIVARSCQGLLEHLEPGRENIDIQK